MKVGQQRINGAKGEAGVNKQVGFFLNGRHRFPRAQAGVKSAGLFQRALHAGAAQGGGFQRAHGGGADHHQPAAGQFGIVNAPGGGGRQAGKFAVDGMLLHLLNTDRLKGVQPNVQGYVIQQHAVVAQGQQHLRRKVQPGSGRGRRAVNAAENGLIAFAVIQTGVDVGRQRGVAYLIEAGVDRPVKFNHTAGLAQIFNDGQPDLL